MNTNCWMQSPAGGWGRAEGEDGKGRDSETVNSDTGLGSRCFCTGRPSVFLWPYRAPRLKTEPLPPSGTSRHGNSMKFGFQIRPAPHFAWSLLSVAWLLRLQRLLSPLTPLVSPRLGAGLAEPHTHSFAHHYLIAMERVWSPSNNRATTLT